MYIFLKMDDFIMLVYLRRISTKLCLVQCVGPEGGGVGPNSLN